MMELELVLGLLLSWSKYELSSFPPYIRAESEKFDSG